MAEVVFHGIQYLSDVDLAAMATYLKELPQAAPGEIDREGWWSWFGRRKAAPVFSDEARARGADIYKQRCADCHGENGEGAVDAFPSLSGNRAVTMRVPANLIRVVLSGGFLPATHGNPRPYGMPPFAHVLSDAEIAAVLSYIRTSWGNDATPVSALEVQQYRARRVQ